MKKAIERPASHQSTSLAWKLRLIISGEPVRRNNKNAISDPAPKRMAKQIITYAVDLLKVAISRSSLKLANAVFKLVHESLLDFS